MDFAALRQQREQEEQQCRDAVIAEFGDDKNAMAGEILRYRRCMQHLAEVMEWARVGAPFAVVPPGPHWEPPAS